MKAVALLSRQADDAEHPHAHAGDRAEQADYTAHLPAGPDCGEIRYSSGGGRLRGRPGAALAAPFEGVAARVDRLTDRGQLSTSATAR
ncbi:hypothetical protein QJS66_16240 [Kocuria rhizophila]|nr:hypothetical protein QJS66_16240 [Kocuria rhizophila]